LVHNESSLHNDCRRIGSQFGGNLSGQQLQAMGMGNDQDIKFQEIERLISRSKVFFDQEIESINNAFESFNLLRNGISSP
jgi:hypothetical protein